MKALICEMCGSNDIIKQDGLYVCQNCGTKYTVEEAKKLFSGDTIKIDGVVKVSNNEFESKLAKADNMAEVYFKRGYWYVKKQNMIGYNAVMLYYVEAENVGANESSVYLNMSRFMLKALPAEYLAERIKLQSVQNVIETYSMQMDRAIKYADENKRDALTKEKEEGIAELENCIPEIEEELRKKQEERLAERLERAARLKKDRDDKLSETIEKIKGQWKVIAFIVGTIILLLIPSIMRAWHYRPRHVSPQYNDVEEEKQSEKTKTESEEYEVDEQYLDSTPLSSDLLVEEHYRCMSKLINDPSLLDVDTYYYYLDDGNMLAKVAFQAPNNPCCTIEGYQYNENNKKIIKNVYTYFSKNGQYTLAGSAQTQYHYNPDSTISREILKNGYTDYTYNDHGDVETIKDYINIANQGLYNVETFKYTYDENNQITECIKTSADGNGGNKKTDKTRYFYDKGGKLVKKWEDKSGYSETDVYFYEYDEEGHLIKMQETDITGRDVYFETTYSYVNNPADSFDSLSKIDKSIASIFSDYVPKKNEVKETIDENYEQSSGRYDENPFQAYQDYLGRSYDLLLASFDIDGYDEYGRAYIEYTKGNPGYNFCEGQILFDTDTIASEDYTYLMSFTWNPIQRINGQSVSENVIYSMLDLMKSIYGEQSNSMSNAVKKDGMAGTMTTYIWDKGNYYVSYNISDYDEGSFLDCYVDWVCTGTE